MVLDINFYNHLHALENRYGSIAKAPDADDDMLAIRDIFPSGNNQDAIVRSILPRVRKLLQDGYSNVEIKSKFEYPEHAVELAIKISQIKPKKSFNFKISKDNKIYYTSSILHLLKGMGRRFEYFTHDDGVNYLRASGYTISRGHYHWCDIHHGDFYVKQNSHKIARKV